MAEETLFVKKSSLTAIADAVRAKTGKTDPLVFPQGIVDEVASISGKEPKLLMHLDGTDRGGVPGKWIDKIQGITFDLQNVDELDNGIFIKGIDSYARASNTIPNNTMPLLRSYYYEYVISVKSVRRDWVLLACDYGLYSTNPDIRQVVLGGYDYSMCFEDGTGGSRGFKGNIKSGFNVVRIGSASIYGGMMASVNESGLLDMVYEVAYSGERKGLTINPRHSDSHYVFQGTVHEIRVYEGPLSSSAMQANYEMYQKKYNAQQS